MKTRNIYTLVLMLLTFGAVAQVDRSKLPEPATPRPIELGNYESFELKNGLKVFVIENHKLPSMSVTINFDRVTPMEGDKAGMIGMFGSMLRAGTTNRSKEQLDEELDFIGARLRAGSTSIGVSGLSKHQDKMLELMTDVLFNPTFPAEELEKVRTRTISGLESAQENPDAMSGNLNLFTVYGMDHPYGEMQTIETTKNIAVEDFKAYYDTYFRPNVAYMAVVGDVDPKQIKKSFKKMFGKWEAKDFTNPTYELPQPSDKNIVNVVNKSGAVQSVISVTYPVELPFGHVDLSAVAVMTKILGGGFASRLNMNLREDKAYTYGARASLSADELVARFSAGAKVRNEVTDSAVVQIFHEMNQMMLKEVTDEEIELAKNSLAGNFARSLESAGTLASFALRQAIYNLPDDYYATYIQRIQSVTKADVQSMAKKYLKPSNAYVNVVGKGSEIKSKLSQFGEIKYWDMYGNPAEEPKAELPAGLTLEKVFEDYVNAIGGKEKVQSVKSMKIVMEGSVQGQSMEIEVTRKSPSKSLTIMKMGGNPMNTTKFNGEKGSMKGMMGTQSIEGEYAKDMAIETAMTPELRYAELGATATLIAAEEVNGQLTYVVEVKSPSGKVSKRFYSAETKLLARTSNTVQGPQGEMTMNTDIKEYKEFDGIMVPTLIIQPMGPMKLEFKAKTVEINPQVDDKIFE